MFVLCNIIIQEYKTLLSGQIKLDIINKLFNFIPLKCSKMYYKKSM